MLSSTVAADDGLPPSIPQSFEVQPTSSTTIELQWSPSSDVDGVANYKIYRNGQLAASTQETVFQDTGVNQNSNYYYWVTAVDASNRESSTSKWIYTRTPAGNNENAGNSNVLPNVPVKVTANLQSDGGVQLSWQPGEEPNEISGYNIYRDGQYIRTVIDTVFTDYNSTLNDSTRYSVVNYTADKRFSSHSEEAGISRGSVAPPPQSNALESKPGTVGGLYSSVQSETSLTLHWNRVATAKGYNVYRDNAYIATVSSESFTDEGLSPGQHYEYSVVVFTADNVFSTHSEVHGATTHGAATSAARSQSSDPVTQRSATTRTAIGDDYYLAFSDEFNGNGLDLSKWNTAYLWGPDVTTNNESQYYVDIARNPDFGYQPFHSDGNHLSIKADHTPDWLKNSANGKPYLSGVMTSYDSFQFTYGYAEARLRAPSGNGFFAAFWLLNARYIDLEPEIDITELLGENPYVVHHTYHHRDADYNLVSTPTFDTYVDDFSRDFHTYAVRWSPGEIVWYVDGVETQRYTEGAIAAQPMYVLFNLAIDGDWPQSPDGNTVFPSALEIDYVRVYRK
ncbi:MAG: family 16 glycosylhydrolase [Granulosicoccus sp.]|nr:family 16 glycosylhydrolase [Granulosicoccus sp.]